MIRSSLMKPLLVGSWGSRSYTGFCQYRGCAVPKHKSDTMSSEILEYWLKTENRGYIPFYLQTFQAVSSCQSLGCDTWYFCPCTRWCPSVTDGLELENRWSHDRSERRSLGEQTWVKRPVRGKWRMDVMIDNVCYEWCLPLKILLATAPQGAMGSPFWSFVNGSQ